ncbi:MAG: phosphatase [Oscillospiraceae bacterium]|nr:phosphatase [Oscillospiraceae bacterium]
MYSVKVDAHTHTIFSWHAYGTVAENVAEAAKKGFTGLGISDHFGYPYQPDKGGIPDWTPIGSIRALPKEIDGVRIFCSVEMDIVDFEGHLCGWDKIHKPSGKAYTDVYLPTRDYVIASLHYFDGFRDGTVAQNTEMYLGALRNPYVKFIAHPCRPGVQFDMTEVVRAAKAEGKMLEFNNLTHVDTPRAIGDCMKLAEKCAEEGTMIVVDSDGHCPWHIGRLDMALKALEEIHFPEELIANRSLESFMAAIGMAE